MTTQKIAPEDETASPEPRFPNASAASPGTAETAALLRALDEMKDRENRLMELLHTTAPERIEHDVRNVLNELVLLRTLLDLKSRA